MEEFSLGRGGTGVVGEQPRNNGQGRRVRQGGAGHLEGGFGSKEKEPREVPL